MQALGSGSESKSNTSDDGTETKHTFCPLEFRDKIIKMLEEAYCAHPMIPGHAADHRDAIYEWATRRIYIFCKENDLRELWAYLWMNWLCLERWELWARSTCPDEIAILKTTMICESQ